MKQKRLFWVSSVCYLFSSASVLLMQFGDIDGKSGSKAVAVLAALLFWLFLITGITAQYMLYRIQRDRKKRINFIVNMLTEPTSYFYISLIICIAALIVMKLMNYDGFVSYIFISLLIYSIEMIQLTGGKFIKRNGRLIFKTYRITK